MISKRLAIAVAVIVLTGATVGQALAQQGGTTPPPAPTMASPTAPGAAPGAPGAAPAAAPAATPAPAPGAPNAGPPKENPYGIAQLWAGQNGQADWVARGVMILLGIMSVGTWYIFFMKFFEQSRILGQASQVERRFWSSNNLNEGIDKLAKNSVFRTLAESGVRASSGQGSGIVNLNDWIAMSLNRQLEEINAKLQGGIAFLASVGSTAPFVGLFGTVWGILNALIAIGVAGQASIDKVAGPVGEALIMTALGLLVAVPGVLLYNFLVRRNKVISEKLKAFATDLQTYLVTKGK
ncbi:MAG: MotA/TolQ/ExbB proton channel family protein [Rhizomicrobium sp.]